MRINRRWRRKKEKRKKKKRGNEIQLGGLHMGTPYSHLHLYPPSQNPYISTRHIHPEMEAISKVKEKR